MLLAAEAGTATPVATTIATAAMPTGATSFRIFILTPLCQTLRGRTLPRRISVKGLFGAGRPQGPRFASATGDRQHGDHQLLHDWFPLSSASLEFPLACPPPHSCILRRPSGVSRRQIHTSPAAQRALAQDHHHSTRFSDHRLKLVPRQRLSPDWSRPPPYRQPLPRNASGSEARISVHERQIRRREPTP